jgi:transcription initiation factor TFIIIB Brf1 subunit/transcription initiation factor TFIIB
MKTENTVLERECSYCGSTNLESDETMIRCLDCGMGNYKAGWHKGAR